MANPLSKKININYFPDFFLFLKTEISKKAISLSISAQQCPFSDTVYFIYY